MNYFRFRAYNHHPDYGPISDTYYVFILPYSLVKLIPPIRNFNSSSGLTFCPSSGIGDFFTRIDILPSGIVFYHPELRSFQPDSLIPSGIPKLPSGFVFSHPDLTNPHPEWLLLVPQAIHCMCKVIFRPYSPVVFSRIILDYQ